MTPERWRKIESIFQTVIEKPKPERQMMLTQYCGDDTELRREVEALLSEDETNDFDEFIQSPIKNAARSLPQSQTDNYIGRNIGPYQVVKLLGQGGMGAVYLAERSDAEYYRQVALKIVRRGMDSSFVLKRFRVERQILATLEHPNIAQLLDGGTTTDGLPYFVMEYVPGKPLTEYCNAGGLSLVDRLKLFLPVCAAVQHAHQKLIVHRDLKPSNILVTPSADGKDGVPKLLDFGIAKLLDPSLSPTTLTRTQTSMRMMTPDYASPEQVRGLPITTASDVYTLGVILFELLTGERPYQFETYSPAEIERAICDTEIERPSVVAGRTTNATLKFRRQLSGDLDNIVLMALRKEPDRRYQSVGQLAEDIRCYLEGRPISARRESAIYRTGKFVRRNKLAVAAAALILFSLLGGIVTTSRAARIAQTERARAEANLIEAQAQRAEADRQRLIAEEQRARAENETAEANLQRQIAEAQRAEADAQRRNTETQQERAERRFAQVRKLANTFLFDFHDQIASLPGSTAAREMVVKTALEYLDSLAKDAESDASLQNELAAAYLRVADVQGNPRQPNLGNREAAFQSYRRSLELSEKLRANGQGDAALLRRMAETYAKTGEVARFMGKSADAKAAYQKALFLAEQLLVVSVKEEIGHHTITLVYEGLGNLANLEGNDSALSLSYQRRSLAAVERWVKEASSDRARQALAVSYLQLGGKLLPTGAIEEAEEVENRGVAILKEMLQTSPGNLRYKTILADLYGELGNVAKAKNNPTDAAENYRRSLTMCEEMAAQDPKNALARLNVRFQAARLGEALLEIDPPQALTVLRKALDRGPDAKPLPPESRVHQLPTNLNLARALWLTGDRTGAEQTVRDIQALLESVPASKMYASGFYAHAAQLRLGNLLVEMGDTSNGLSHLQQSLQTLRTHLAATPQFATYRRELSGCYNALGNYHAKLAALSGASAEQRLREWKESRNWYQQNLTILQEHLKQAPNDSQSAKYVLQAAKNISQCDAAISALAIRQQH
ncbi:MAG: protein kinase domain-containing protein [Blastocatellia bacterium]